MSTPTGTDAADAAERLAAATRIYATMRYLVLEGDDRRAEVSEALGMSFIRAKALRRLAVGPMKMSDLTAVLATDKPYTTLIVDDLERRGLVVRSVHPDDRRIKVVTVTEAGLAAAAVADGILSRPLSGLLTLETAELAELERVLGKL